MTSLLARFFGRKQVNDIQITLTQNGIGQEFKRYVLVLDISGSMEGTNGETMQLGIRRIIDELPIQSYLAIVLFNDRFEVAQKMIQITNEQIRQQLYLKIPSQFNRSTDIAGGVLCGIKTFLDENISTHNALMYLLTDGHHNCGPDYIERVLPTLIETEIIVNCISYGEADPKLKRLSRETGGTIFSSSNDNRELAAVVIQRAIQVERTSREIAPTSDITICDEVIHLDNEKTVKNILIDADIGCNTIFHISSFNYESVLVNITSPSGKSYNRNSDKMICNVKSKRYQLKIDNAEHGIWTITLDNLSQNNIGANICVRSQIIGLNAVQMKITLKDGTTVSPPIIIAELRKGSNVLIGAEVTAIVEVPGGQKKLILANYNNIYCNYFTEFVNSGLYNVSVYAKNGLGCYLKELTSDKKVIDKVPNFERQQISGSFKVKDNTSRNVDTIKLERFSHRSEFKAESIDTGARIEAPAPRTARAVNTNRY